MCRGGNGESCKIYCDIRDKKIETEPAVILECGIRGAGELDVMRKRYKQS